MIFFQNFSLRQIFTSKRSRKISPATVSKTSLSPATVSKRSRKISPATVSKTSVSPCGEKRLRKELSRVEDHILMAHIRSRLASPENVFRWEATIVGPANCPFENGVFAVSVHVPTKFPFKPPIIKFKTKIFHPNINKKGEISLDILGSGWSPTLRIHLVLLAICSVLSDPVEPFLADNPAARLYQEDRKAYEMIAREWTMEYAKAEFLS